MRVPEHREEKITALLERWPELRETLNSGQGVAGDGGSLTLMPHERRCLLSRKADRDWQPGMEWVPARCTCAYRGVAELERLLRGMRDQGGQIVTLGSLLPGLRSGHVPAQADIRVSVRALWWHLSQQYIASTVRIGKTHVPKLDENGRQIRVKGKPVSVPWPKREVVVDKRVNPLVVRAGVRWLAEGWSLEVEPFMPQELLVAA